MADRRDALKIIGAIGTTCAFPFSADELYGQHAHPATSAQAVSKPQFFTPDEFAVISRVADLIIPRTDTPGAVDAGVPAYIDYVVRNNKVHQETFRSGLAWLKDFLDKTEAEQIGLLQAVSDEIDQGISDTPEQKFFRAIKAMTADGYYTSKIGLTSELGYQGGAVLAEYPACEIPEH